MQIAFAILLFAIATFPQPDQFADVILHNGAIYTVNPREPWAEAVAIKGDRIIAVGSDTDVLRLRGAQTKVTDLQRRFALPGFNDNHVHFAQAAAFLEFNIMAVSTQEEFLRRLKAVTVQLAEGEWILGGYWGAYDQWAAGSTHREARRPFVPDMTLADEVTRRYPVFIRKFDDSEFAANSAALAAIGIDTAKPNTRGAAGDDVSDVIFERDARGRPTGIMRGKGVARLFAAKIPRRFSHSRRVEQTRRALAEIRRFGVTNVSDMSDDEQLEIYRELRDRGELTVRVHFRYGLERWRELADKGIKVGSGDEWIQLGALKGHIDGIMGTSSARFFEPYSNNPSSRGRWRPLMVDEKGNFIEGRFLGYMLEADKAGLQLTVHAIGDEANHVLLNYLEEVEKKNGARDRRFRLVHAQVIATEDFKRLGKLKVVAEVQPFHLSDDMRWMEERIGATRNKGAYAFKTIKESGAVLSFGTDWPGTSAAEYPINPMLGLYAAVTRRTLRGEPRGGWFPDERLSIEDAIKAYTYGTAYANFEEGLKGSIEVGKIADIVVLTQNLVRIPLDEILKTEVIHTIVGGKFVYSAR